MPRRPVTRRSMIAGTAWTVPAIVAVGAAPTFAASPCAPVPFPTGWVIASPASGTLAGSGNGYTTTYASNGANTYLSVQDNNSTAISSNAANDATVTVSRALTLVVGRAYTFSFTVASQHGSNSETTSQLQLLDIQFNNVSAGRYTTQTSQANDSIKATRAAGYTALATPASGIGTQTITLSYTPTVAAVTLRYLFTLPARGYNPIPIVGTPGSTYTGGSDDIAISAPSISGC